MSFQDSNQQPFPAPQPGWGGAQPQPQPGQQPPPQAWGQQGQQPPPSAWGQQGQPAPQQPPAQSSWGAPDQAPVSGGQGQGWGPGSQQPQAPAQPGYGYGQGAAPGQSFGQPQDYAAQNFPQQTPPGQIPQQQGYASGGYASGSVGYHPQQSDFGSGVGYGPGYPGPGQQESRLATVALWLGILGGWALINLVVSILAINETGPGKKAGRGKALTGLYLTLVWCVIWIGVFVAVSGHARNAASTTPPPNLYTSIASPGATAVYLTGATDPGCLTVQNAFNHMEASKTSSSAVTAFISALQTGAGQSRIAGNEISTVATEWSQIGTTSQTQMFDDMQAMQTACAMTVTSTDPR